MPVWLCCYSCIRRRRRIDAVTTAAINATNTVSLIWGGVQKNYKKMNTNKYGKKYRSCTQCMRALLCLRHKRAVGRGPLKYCGYCDAAGYWRWRASPESESDVGMVANYFIVVAVVVQRNVIASEAYYTIRIDVFGFLLSYLFYTFIYCSLFLFLWLCITLFSGLECVHLQVKLPCARKLI